MEEKTRITVQIPINSGAIPRFLYHFIPKIEVLDSIYSSKEFWLKSVSESNDPDEKYFSNHIAPIYQACFSDSCMEEDLWEEYECGICIQIKPQLTIFSKNNDHLVAITSLLNHPETLKQ